MIAFVLSGGGALGAFEVGVLRQLWSNNIRPDALYGTSTGALNVAGYSFKGITYLENMWMSIKGIEDVFGSRGILTPFYLLFGNGMGIYSTKPLEKKLDGVVNGQPSVKTCVCRVSLRTTSAEYVYAYPTRINDLKTFKKSVLASASTPILNDVVDGEYVDGGVRHIAPVGQAINDGADEIYVILAEQFQENQKPNYSGKIGNVLKVGQYTINTFVQGVLWNDVKICQKINKLVEESNSSLSSVKQIKIHVYAPTSDIGDAQDFSPKHILEIMQIGKTINPVV
jgi:predicted acylesterase/phospholipase RssA